MMRRVRSAEGGGPGVALTRGWGLAFCLLAVPVFALGQGLGDVARKERERRETPREADTTSRTLTDDDLASNPGRLANDPNAPPPESLKEREDGLHRGPDPTKWPEDDIIWRSDDGVVVRLAPGSASKRGDEAYWRMRVGQARLSVALARERYDELDRQIRFGQPVTHNENGRRVIWSIHSMKTRADAALADLRIAEKALVDVLEEARRDGALPGWLRDDGRSARGVSRPR